MEDNDIIEKVEECSEKHAPEEKDGDQLSVDEALDKNVENVTNMSNEEEEEEEEEDDREICRNFLSNRCRRGNTCKYIHPSSGSSESHLRNRSRSPNTRDSDAICRDYLRNMCKRGDDCRYYHPSDGEGKKRSWFTRCLDFQNGKCTRHDCRYFHLSDDDEALFKETGEISRDIFDQAIHKSLLLEVTSRNSKPACKDFLKRACKMTNCRYRHVTRREYEDEVYDALRDELYLIIGGESRGNFEQGAPRPHRRSRSPLIGRNMKGNFGRGGTKSLFDSLRSDYDAPKPYFFEGRNDQRSNQGSGYPNPNPESRGNELENLRSECFELRNLLQRIKRERDEERREMERKLSEHQIANAIDLDQNTFDDQGIADDNADPAQLQLNLAKLRKMNSALLRTVTANKNCERLYAEAKTAVSALHNEKKGLTGKISNLEAQVAAYTNESQSWVTYEYNIKDQIYKLQSQLFIVERELSQSWGGGPPPLASQRKSWDIVKTIVAYMGNVNLQSDASGGYSNTTDYNNSGSSYNAGNYQTGKDAYAENYSSYQEKSSTNANYSATQTFSQPQKIQEWN